MTTSNPIPPVGGLTGASGPTSDDATREVDGDVALDPDVDDNQVDSAEADRLATNPDDDDDLYDGGLVDDRP